MRARPAAPERPTSAVCLGVAGLLLCVLSACAGGPATVPVDLEQVPGSLGPVDAELLAARSLEARGESLAALRVVEGLLARRPELVDARRLRQDLLRGRGRRGLLLVELETLEAEGRAGAAESYLRGRLALTNDDRLAAFEAAVEDDPALYWGWHGLAFALRDVDPEASLTLYRQLHERTEQALQTAVAAAAALRRVGTDESNAAALSIYRGLRDSPHGEGIGALGMAETLLAMERPRESWAALLEALRRLPYDDGVRQMIDRFLVLGVGRDQLGQLRDILREDPAGRRDFARGLGALLLARIEILAGRPHSALRVLRDAEPAVAASPTGQRMLRRLLLEIGRIGEFLAVLDASLPAPLLADESNQVRGLWLAVLQGPWRTRPDPLAEGDEAADLMDALLRAGMLEEAERLGDVILARHDGPALVDRVEQLQDEARRELALEGAIRRIVYQGFRQPDMPLDAMLDEFRRVARRTHPGEDVVGNPRRFDIPFVGTMIDPFDAGLGRWLARYNRHLVLGRRSGGAIEAILTTRLSVRQLEPDDRVPVPERTREVIGFDRRIRSLGSVLGGDLAGVALVSHYLLDLDAIRDWANGLAERRRIAREDGLALLEDPLPTGVDDLDPVQADWRLEVEAPVADEDLLLAVVEMVRWHERAHITDAHHYLPPEARLWRVLGLLISHGFSAFGVEATMEGRAELAALACSEHTRLVLGHIAGFLENDDGSSPHARGFRDLARSLQSGLRRAGVPAADTAASRWHRLDPETVRRVAGEMLQGLW